MTEGIKETHWTYQDSRVHMLAVDLTKRELRPVLDKQEFPFNEGFPQKKAIEQGCVACHPGGFNIVLFHGLGIQDQPQHALVVDEEIWTTGLGGGGYGVLIGDGQIATAKNRLQVHLWLDDGNGVEVEHVNRGHEGEVVAFTSRGGTNEFPKYKGKWFYVINLKSGVVGHIQRTPPNVWASTYVVESTYDLGLVTGEVVKWKQVLADPFYRGVKHIVSGSHEIVREGKDVVDEYEMDPTASHGPDNWFVRRNPRTALGASQDGKTAYMICVEGRLPNSYRPDAEKSRGLRLKALAETAVKNGVWSLVNMDGGGSAFQWRGDDLTATWGCYNSSHNIDGQRRAHFSAAVF